MSGEDQERVLENNRIASTLEEFLWDIADLKDPDKPNVEDIKKAIKGHIEKLPEGELQDSFWDLYIHLYLLETAFSHLEESVKSVLPKLEEFKEENEYE